MPGQKDNNRNQMITRLAFINGIVIMSASLVIICCTNKKKDRKLIGTTTRQYLRVLTYDQADCGLKCKSTLDFVAANDSAFSIIAEFDINYQFADHDSATHKSILLKPLQSKDVACGCEEKPVAKGDWQLDVTILAAHKVDE